MEQATTSSSLKEQLLLMARKDLEDFLYIVGEISYDGYLVLKFVHKGNSYRDCCREFGISKGSVQKIIRKCTQKGYTNALIKMNMLK